MTRRGGTSGIVTETRSPSAARRDPPHRAVVDGDTAAGDPRLHPRARRCLDVPEVPPQHAIEADAGVAAVGDQGALRRGHVIIEAWRSTTRTPRAMRPRRANSSARSPGGGPS